MSTDTSRQTWIENLIAGRVSDEDTTAIARYHATASAPVAAPRGRHAGHAADFTGPSYRPQHVASPAGLATYTVSNAGW